MSRKQTPNVLGDLMGEEPEERQQRPPRAKPEPRPKAKPEPEPRPEREAAEGKRYPPSVRGRWERQLTVTFTSGEVTERLRQIALEWGLYAPDGKSPATSTVVEWLLHSQIEAAEAGEIGPPPRGWRQERRQGD